MLKTSRGFTLVEVMVAMLILGLAVLPLIQVFSKTYYVATRQYEEVLALKIAEATMNKAAAWNFQELDQPSGPFSLPIDVYIPAEVTGEVATFSGSLGITGTPASGSCSIKYKSTNFNVRLQVNREYEGPQGAATAMVFYSAAPDLTAGGTPPPMVVASYACPDTFLRLEVNVGYGKFNKSVKLTSFRANLNE